MRKKNNIYFEKIRSHRFTQKTLEWSKSYKMPGSQGIPLFDIIKFIYEEIKKDNLTTRANSVAFSLFIAIFPSIIFLFTLLPYLPFTEDYTLAISTSTKKLLPISAHDYLMSIINDITKIKREGLLSLGFLFALYFSSNGVLSLMRGFDKSYRESFQRRSIFYKRGIAVFLTFVLGFIFIASIILLIIGRTIFNEVDNMIDNDTFTNIVFELIRIITALLITFLGVNVLFHFGPSLRKKLPFLNPGSIIATALIFLTSIVFAFFINNFGQFNKIYGSIGALIVILLWMKINAFILLAGFEFNAAIAINRDKKLNVSK